MNKLWRLTVREQFSAAHALRHYEGKCENLHGHNFRVEICVEGAQPDAKTGMLIDFKILKKMLKTALDKLDHQFLNNLGYFEEINPSSENIARFIWRQLMEQFSQSALVRDANIALKSVTVAENETQSATYMEV